MFGECRCFAGFPARICFDVPIPCLIACRPVSLLQCFAVRSLGWVEIPEEDLTPGKSSLAVNNCIQQLSHSKCEDRDAMGAWGEVQCGEVGCRLVRSSYLLQYYQHYDCSYLSGAENLLVLCLYCIL